MNPPDNALALSVDEKAQIQAFDRTHPKLQLRPGQGVFRLLATDGPGNSEGSGPALDPGHQLDSQDARNQSLAGHALLVQAALHTHECVLAERSRGLANSSAAHFTSVSELKSAIKKFIKVHNEKLAKPFR